MSALFTTMVSCAVAAMYTQHAYHGARSPRTRALWRRLRWRHLAVGGATLVAVILVGGALFNLAPPLRWGWWTALGGEGSVVFAKTQPGTQSAPWIVQLIPLWMLGMLLLAMPRMVLWEERRFRRGAERFDRRARFTTPAYFGLMHAVMGIPLAFALALGVTGWVLQDRYLRVQVRYGRVRAMREATATHLAYNGLILAILILPALVIAF
jgi:hypothetical protein